jgi:cobaltochelatase CobN
METKIIYLTNDARRYAGMKNACLALQDEGKISDLCMAVKLEGSSEWDRIWERKFGGACLVVARFFRNISKSAFWESCRTFLAAQNIPYLLDAVEGKSDEQEEKSAGVEPSVARG